MSPKCKLLDLKYLYNPNFIFTPKQIYSNSRCIIYFAITEDMCGDPIRPIDIELGSMDFASYQMLSEANTVMVADQILEDSFRLDLKQYKE